MRLAWFSPWPPQKSGVAGRSAELVPALAARGHAIDVMVDAAAVPVKPRAMTPPDAGSVRELSAHDFNWRAQRGQYDLAVYQIGNSHLHRYIWPYVFHAPGLVVIHDACVHHARAEALLSGEREDDYRAEFAWSHPDSPPGIAELAIVRNDGPFFYHWPMIRGVVESARLVACHSRGVVARLAREYPERPLTHIALGEGRETRDPDEGGAFRRANGVPANAMVFGVFGGLTAERRLDLILPAFAETRAWAPNVHLLLAGAPDAALELERRVAEAGLSPFEVTRVESLNDQQFEAAIAACDVALNLRWPSARETSGPWVRCLAAGKPTVVLDLEHQTHVPSLDPRTWQVRPPAGANAEAVTVAIEVLDVKHSLRLAMRRLAVDAGLRVQLGAAARRWWTQEHTFDRMLADYERALARAITEPIPHPDLPAHMRPDPFAHAAQLFADDNWTPIRHRLIEKDPVQ